MGRKSVSVTDRIISFVKRLPRETRAIVRDEIALFVGINSPVTRTRPMLPGEPRKRGYHSWKCSGITWPADEVKKGSIQMCPREDLTHIRYNFKYDMVERFCSRCGTYLAANPDDHYMDKLKIPIECPKLGWRPNPMTPGWKP